MGMRPFSIRETIRRGRGSKEFKGRERKKTHLGTMKSGEMKKVD